jgi:hypothetical protein
VAAVLAFAPIVAEATPYASSTMELTNVDFDAPAFSTFFFRLNQTSATLNGVTVNSPGNQIETASGSVLDQPVSCVGNCGSFVNNVFFPTPNVNVVPGSYAVADSHMLSTVINPQPPATNGAGTFGSRTAAQLAGGTAGSAQTGTDNTLQWNFTIGADDTAVSLEFDITHNFHLHKDAIGELAAATQNLLVQIVSQVTGATTTLEAFNMSNSLSQTAGAADLFSFNDLTTHFATPDDLTLDTGTYSLLIRFGTSADVVAAPAVAEPATLTLLGLGLVGAAYVARRRRS